MTDWIHCNKCFLRYIPKFKFYLTSCGHMKCEKCVSSLGSEKRCLVCNSACDLVQLSNNLPSNILNYFRPISEFDSKWKEMYSFQYGNVTSLIKKSSEKYNVAKNEIRKQQKAIEELKKQNAKLQLMLDSTARGAFAVSTPTAGVPITPMNAVSDITPVRSGNASGITMSQINDSLFRFAPWTKQKYPTEMTGHHHTQVNPASSHPVPPFGHLPRSTPNILGRCNRNISTTSKRAPSFGNLHGSAPFIPARHNRENTTPENPARITLARLQFGSSNSSP